MSKSGQIVCWKCGGSLAELSLPLLRLDECPGCHAELHVCRMCEYFDPTVANACREPVAAEVRDKIRANFCDYFRLVPDAYRGVSAEQADAAVQLEKLFGDNTNQDAPGDAPDGLEDLFKQSD